MAPFDLDDWTSATTGPWQVVVRCTLDGAEVASAPVAWQPGSAAAPTAEPAAVDVSAAWEVAGDTLEGVVRVVNASAAPVGVAVPVQVDLDACAGSPWRVAGPARDCAPVGRDAPIVILEPGARLAARVFAGAPLPGPRLVCDP